MVVALARMMVTPRTMLTRMINVLMMTMMMMLGMPMMGVLVHSDDAVGEEVDAVHDVGSCNDDEDRGGDTNERDGGALSSPGEDGIADADGGTYADDTTNGDGGTCARARGKGGNEGEGKGQRAEQRRFAMSRCGVTNFCSGDSGIR